MWHLNHKWLMKQKQNLKWDKSSLGLPNYEPIMPLAREWNLTVQKGRLSVALHCLPMPCVKKNLDIPHTSVHKITREPKKKASAISESHKANMSKPRKPWCFAFLRGPTVLIHVSILTAHMQLGAANYKWMVFIHYRRPSRKVSLLSNTMLISVWLSKDIKLLWIKRFLKRVVSPSFLSLYGGSRWRASGPFPALLLAPVISASLIYWWAASPVNSYCKCMAYPLCPFPGLFAFQYLTWIPQSHLSPSVCM